MQGKPEEAEAGCPLLHSYLLVKGQRWDQGPVRLAVAQRNVPY